MTGITRDPIKDARYRFGREMPRPITKARHKKLLHDNNGFPHYSSITGECMCLDTCCQDDLKGCICKTCPCSVEGHISGQKAV